MNNERYQRYSSGYYPGPASTAPDPEHFFRTDAEKAVDMLLGNRIKKEQLDRTTFTKRRLELEPRMLTKEELEYPGCGARPDMINLVIIGLFVWMLGITLLCKLLADDNRQPMKTGETLTVLLWPVALFFVILAGGFMWVVDTFFKSPVSITELELEE